MEFFVNAKLREEFKQRVVQQHVALPVFRPWMCLSQSNSALLFVSQCGTKYQLCGPKARYVSDVMNEKEYFSLLKKLGSVPELWPDNERKVRK